MITGMRNLRRIPAPQEAGYKYYRLLIDRTDSGEVAFVGALHIKTSKFPNGEVSGGVATASDWQSPHVPQNAFEYPGNLADSSVWDAGRRVYPQWLQYEFSNPQKVSAYALARPDRGGTSSEGFPVGWKFMASDDGVNWEVLHTEDLWPGYIALGEIRWFEI